MPFPFEALIDGEVVIKYGDRTALDPGGRPDTTLVDVDGATYQRSQNNDLLWEPVAHDVAPETVEVQPSHEPQNVTMNGSDSIPGEGTPTPEAPFAADADALGTSADEVELTEAAKYDPLTMADEVPPVTGWDNKTVESPDDPALD